MLFLAKHQHQTFGSPDQIPKPRLQSNTFIPPALQPPSRRAKQQLLTAGIEGLVKKLRRRRCATRAEYEERQGSIRELVERIYSVPDGLGGGRTHSFGAQVLGRGGVR
jgi:hypothetical protein